MEARKQGRDVQGVEQRSVCPRTDGLVEMGEQKGARTHCVFVTLILRRCAHFFRPAVLCLYILEND